MPFPVPVPGLLVRDSYLWASEHARGQGEGVKDLYCAVVLVVQNDAGDQSVTVLPVSHSPPADPTFAVEIASAVKQRLQLDDDRSWVLLTEANRFIWPGPDLRPLTSGNPASVAYGPLPHALFDQFE